MVGLRLDSASTTDCWLMRRAGSDCLKQDASTCRSREDTLLPLPWNSSCILDNLKNPVVASGAGIPRAPLRSNHTYCREHLPTSGAQVPASMFMSHSRDEEENTKNRIAWRVAMPQGSAKRPPLFGHGIPSNSPTAAQPPPPSLAPSMQGDLYSSSQDAAAQLSQDEWKDELWTHP